MAWYPLFRSDDCCPSLKVIYRVCDVISSSTLMFQVGQLEAAAVGQSKEFDNLREELSDALAEVDEEKER